jgi:hypothetical protein
MGEKRTKVSRRDFIRTVAGVPLIGAMGPLVASSEEPSSEQSAKSPKTAKVVLVRDEAVLSKEGKLDGAVLQQMFDDAVTTLLGKPDPAAAWKSLVRPTHTAGIKSNVWSYLRTPPELEKTIVQRLTEAGVTEERIGIDDRGVLRNPVFSKATALINVRPMRTHHWSGVGSLIKNYIMFHPIPSEWHGDSCADLAGVWNLPIVKGKTRLNVLVMLTPLFQSKGPHAYNRRYTWSYRGLLVGTDPVATDATGLRILQAKRREFFGDDRPFEVTPKHIQVAEQKFDLGVADPKRIDVIKLGLSEGALI